ncbi:MAG TPA: fasciclin domain-containing protein [Burkholderiales bacterium]|nr:fasciclin domain-containing protein [Burkholderiales bacterium]
METFRAAGPFTVFAPTDAAFKTLPAGTIEGLYKDRGKLAAILTRHVLPGLVMAKGREVGGCHNS